ncbi:heme-binding protein 2-like [Larimichthys crocea]|uniref:heme-binding protein 2-like n=1 Tax=Larimichthys crocea TaxID=215358 RepID=UPI000F5DE088|nr:heme-binding protein 2-like [Larimichthys crocea]
MIYLSGLVGLLLVLTVNARVGNSTIDFCWETEQCLLFDLICETDKFEARHYDSVKWVSSDETSCIMEVAAMRAFRRLQEYITGTNENGQEMKMVAPVIVKISDKRMWESGTYTVSFLLPAEHQQNPPKPIDDKVYIHVMPKMEVYVLSYGGWMISMVEHIQAYRLSCALDSVDAKYKKGFHYAVGYNGFTTFFNRHNEVWFVIEDEPECSSSSEEL